MDKLLPYQLEGARFLSVRKAALLADEMGLGKTVQAITACDCVDAKLVTVVCPAIAQENWRREFERWSRTRIRPFIFSYEKATRLASTMHEMDALILDESQYLKTPTAKRTLAILGKGGLRDKTKRIWMLSGTPMPNHPGELWTMLRVFGRTPMDYMSFIAKFCEFAVGKGPSSGMMQIVGAKKAMIPELKELLQPITLRRTKADKLDLPPMMFSDIVVKPGKVNFSPEDLQKLERETALLKEFFPVHLSDAEKLRVLESLAGSVATLRRYNGLKKVQPTIDLISSELETKLYAKIVVFAIHREVVQTIACELLMRGYGTVVLQGGMTDASRNENIDDFQRNPKARVCVANIRAAGTAVTLTASDQVLFVEQEWTPAENAQAAARLHRIGQKRPVTARFMAIAHSIDEKVANVLRRKTQDISAIF